LSPKSFEPLFDFLAFLDQKLWVIQSIKRLGL